jgi:hypothetical protein
VIVAALLIALAAGALIAALAAAGVGGGGSGSGSGSAGATDTVRLTVTFNRRPGERRLAHLRCSGSSATADGFLRTVGARRACVHARRIVGLLTSGPRTDRACSEIFGGPERALVTGRIGARTVRHTFKRTDSCEIGDWRRAQPLLPRPG